MAARKDALFIPDVPSDSAGFHALVEEARQSADPVSAALGMYLFSNAAWLAREMQQGGFDRIVFIARDGWWVKQAYDIIAPSLGVEVPSDYVRISRQAAFPLHFRQAGDLAHMADWVDVTAHTPETLNRLLAPNIRVEEMPSLMARYGVKKDERLTYGVPDGLLEAWSEAWDQERADQYREHARVYIAPKFSGKCATFDVGYNLRSEAVIRDLTVQGEILPSGTEPATGGIAGENAGRIENCRFMGKVSGSTAVGGIAGVNTVTGILENCRVTGSIKGSHFTGGIAGENAGVIRSCTNAAGINTTARQNTVALEDITLDALTDTESAGTVTDLGGNAGASSGIIRSCTNNGNIGYRHMSYNVGGIAGSSTGYLADCTNYGRIQGRKEAGGIAGQLEPALRIQYSADALQILQQQLGDLAVEAEQTALAAEGSANSLRGQLNTLRQQANAAADAAGQLIPEIDPENPQLPDADSLLALQNALTGSLTQLGGTATGIVSSTRGSTASLLERLEGLNKQMEAIGSTLDNADSLLGGSVTDVSDEDTDADVSAKITGCTNHGSVSADRNAGGIVGAVGPENDLDPEDDAVVDGSYSLNATGEIRAVVRNCTNRAAVSCKYRNAGGIAGQQIMGLLRDCLNTGAIEAADADCAGGIAGSSTGAIRSCSARCTIAAKKQVGGIAGSGAAVTDCRAMTAFAGAVQSTGGILGIRTEPLFAQEEPISGNLYTRTGAKDPGGIDGVSYADKAQPLPLDAFLALEGLDEAFRHAAVTFRFADGSTAQV